MVDRLELAKEYVQELLEERDDIVGAFVVGSVARGDADESSDIDLGLISEGRGDGELQRGGMDAWREGVYIEAAVASMETYGDSTKVFEHRYASTHMNDALILYDPSGVLTRVQEEVRAVYMEPKYLTARVHAAVEALRQSVASLRKAAEAGDPPKICDCVGYAQLRLACMPLILDGTAPSSTKVLVQLDEVSPEWKERMCQWEGSARLSQSDVLATLPTTLEGLSLIQVTGSTQWGDICSYMMKKANWFVKNGRHREAVHLLWYVIGGLDEVIRETSDPVAASRSRELVNSWLHAVGWEGQEVLEEKVRIAEEMVAEVEAMAAHVPSAEPE